MTPSVTHPKGSWVPNKEVSGAWLTLGDRGDPSLHVVAVPTLPSSPDWAADRAWACFWRRPSPQLGPHPGALAAPCTPASVSPLQVPVPAGPASRRDAAACAWA